MGISFSLGDQAWLSHVLGCGLSKILVSMVSCSVFFGCFSEVLLRRELLPFASQAV